MSRAKRAARLEASALTDLKNKVDDLARRVQWVVERRQLADEETFLSNLYETSEELQRQAEKVLKFVEENALCILYAEPIGMDRIYFSETEGWGVSRDEATRYDDAAEWNMPEGAYGKEYLGALEVVR
jgi:hypothetical protein